MVWYITSLLAKTPPPPRKIEHCGQWHDTNPFRSIVEIGHMQTVTMQVRRTTDER